MMFHLHVEGDNDDVISLCDKTDVDHNTCVYPAYHKAVKRHPSKQINNFDVILFQI